MEDIKKHAPLSVVRLIVEFLFLSIPPLHHTRAVTQTHTHTHTHTNTVAVESEMTVLTGLKSDIICMAILRFSYSDKCLCTNI